MEIKQIKKDCEAIYKRFVDNEFGVSMYAEIKRVNDNWFDKKSGWASHIETIEPKNLILMAESLMQQVEYLKDSRYVTRNVFTILEIYQCLRMACDCLERITKNEKL